MAKTNSLSCDNVKAGPETALSLFELAQLTWPAFQEKVTFEDYCIWLFERRRQVWTICSGNECLGMIVAYKKSPKMLYITTFVTLRPDGLPEFVRQAESHYGPLDWLQYSRRGKIKTINFRRFEKCLAALAE